MLEPSGAPVRYRKLLRFFSPVLQLPLDGVIALARGILQLRSIENRDVATVVVNQASPLQNRGGHRHAGASSAQHLRKELLGERQNVLTNAVLAHQKPSRQPLVDFMEAVAGRNLGNF